MSEEPAAGIEGSDIVSISGGGHTMPPKDHVAAFTEHIEKHPVL